MRSDCVSIFGFKKVNTGGSIERVSRSVMEQGMNINFCFKIGKTASETYELLKIAYEDAVILAPILSNGMHTFAMAGKARKMVSAVDDPSQNE